MPTPSYINPSESYSTPSQLKIAIIREELVALTGDALYAVVLNQFMYWTSRIRDHDQFILEEQQRRPDDSVLPLRHGWIYKRASDLIVETMLSISDATMRRIIKKLEERGWISERQNPDNKWDKVLQYRTNIVKIQYDLQQLGYTLSGFKPLANFCHSPSITFATTNSASQDTNLQNKASNFQNDCPKLQIDASKLQNSGLSTEIIPKIISETSSATPDDTIVMEKEISIKMVKIWNAALADQVSIDVHAARRQRLKKVLANVFAGDLSAWQTFCCQVANTPFLQGQGPNNWKARLDWCLSDDKAHRILDGYYNQCWSTGNSPDVAVASADDAQLLAQCQANLIAETCSLGQLLKQQLLENNGLVIYQRWFQDLQVQTMQDQILTLSHPRPYSRQQLNHRFQPNLLKATQQLWPQINKVQVGTPQQGAGNTIEASHNKLDLAIDKLGLEHGGHPIPDARL